MKQKVKIEYGIFSGEHNGQRLRKVLTSSGYEVVKNTAEADFIMAHSAGCFWLEDATERQKLILIDPPYWPGKTIRERASAQRQANFKFRQYEYHFRPWIAKNLWGVYYAVRDFRRTVRIIRYAFRFNLEDTVSSHQHTLLVRNHQDTWLTPELSALKRLNHKLNIIEVPGSHEDITHHPERYVALLQSFEKGGGQ